MMRASLYLSTTDFRLTTASNALYIDNLYSGGGASGGDIYIRPYTSRYLFLGPSAGGGYVAPATQDLAVAGRDAAKKAAAQKEIDVTQSDTSKLVFIAGTGATEEEMLHNSQQRAKTLSEIYSSISSRFSIDPIEHRYSIGSDWINYSSINIGLGDQVILEMSPYDLTRGRIEEV